MQTAPNMTPPTTSAVMSFQLKRKGPLRKRRYYQADQGHHGDDREHVTEGQADAEAEADLPGRDEPARQRPARLGRLRAVAVAQREAVAAGQHGQAERDPAGRQHVHVAGLRQPPRRVGESRARHGRAGLARPELPRQHVGAEERQGMQQDIDYVVPNQRRREARPDHAEREVAQQRVGEGIAVAVGEEGVGVPQVAGIGRSWRGRPTRSSRPARSDPRCPAGSCRPGYRRVGQVMTAASSSDAIAARVHSCAKNAPTRRAVLLHPGKGGVLFAGAAESWRRRRPLHGPRLSRFPSTLTDVRAGRRYPPLGRRLRPVSPPRPAPRRLSPPRPPARRRWSRASHRRRDCHADRAQSRIHLLSRWRERGRCVR